MKGSFISFEGCEGVGKSTQVRMLKEYLEEQNKDILYIREPGGTNISESIRDILLSTKNSNMFDITETMLYVSARVQLINERIKPALEEGKIVICDRFVDSTIAYQGNARGVGIDKIIKLHDLICEGIYPDLTIFLDLEPDLAFKRKGGMDVDDRLELAGLEFHKKVYEGYKAAMKIFPERIVPIQPNGDKYDTHHKIISLIKSKGVI